MSERFDAVVVGSGPNGLAAAAILTAAGLRVRVYEGAATPGGGCRTAELTLPGFRHDVCSAVHPLAAASPFFRWFDPTARGVVLRQPEVAFAQPLDGGRAAIAVRSVEETAAGLGPDAQAYRDLYGPLLAHGDDVVAATLAPIRSLPRRPVTLGRFALSGLRSATAVATSRFATAEARALFGGVAAHAMLPLDRAPSAAFGTLLTLLAHHVGWPVIQGGSGRLVDALTAAVTAGGGEVVTGRWIRSLRELPPARAVLLDVTPRSLMSLAGDRLAPGYRDQLRRFRYGPGVCKVDWALSGPVPWADPRCRQAGTLHLGGRLEEMARSEADVAAGRHPEAPYVLTVQPGIVDATRAPAGQHTLWAYCHVPSGSTVDMSARIEAQIERFAPGFRDLVLARVVRTADQVEEEDPNYVGGDIGAGLATLRQTIARPVARWNPYRTSIDGVYLCSSSTPPGGGVHGMCGWYAARSALGDVFGSAGPPAPLATPSAVAAAS